MAKPAKASPEKWLPPGTLIGHYRVEQLISSGGFGVVYRVSRDGQQFALKLPLPEANITDEERRTLEQRVIREVVSLMTLSHPNIVRVHGFDRWPEPATGALYLVMDLVEGAPLLEWRRNERPTLRELVQVFQALARALDEMHRLGVVHRDLKSTNVLVATRKDKEGASGWKPVLVDFGLARPAFTADVTREYVLVGTEGLWAPEHAAFAETAFTGGARFRFTPATDLHALGLLFYQALTGHRALRTASGDLGAVLTEVPRPPSTVSASIPESLDASLLRLLAKNPEERTASGAKLAEELDALLATADERWDGALPPCAPPTPPRPAALTSPDRPSQLPGRSPSDRPPSPLFLARTGDIGPLPAPSGTVSVTLEVARPPRPAQPRPTRRAPRTLLVAIAGAVALLVGVGGGLGAGSWVSVRTATEFLHAEASSATTPKAPTAAPPGLASARAAASGLQTVIGDPPRTRQPPRPGPRRETLPPQAATPPAPTSPTRVRAEVTGPVRPGAVEAVLREPLVSRGLIVLSAGTVVVGDAAQLADGGFALRFDTAQLRTGAIAAVDGTARLEARAGNRQPLRRDATPTRFDFDVMLAVTGVERRKGRQ